MEKFILKIKNYKPSKYICYLYFFIPIFLCSIIFLDKESDIWFLLNHGKYVLENGFTRIEPFTMHQGFNFVMQQWLSAVIFYISYSLFGKYGLRIIMIIVNCFILYFLYKLCMVLSNNKFRLSIVCSCITQTLLLIFFVPRPWIFTFLNLVIVLYIMELYYKRNNIKSLYFLPMVSLLQINLQSSMWFMIFLFILPYIVCLIINRIKDKNDKKIYKLLIITICMFIVGFINPYGIDNILYVFNSYGIYYINKMVIEMQSPVLGNIKYNLDNFYGIYSILTFILMFAVVGIYIYYKKGKLELRHMFLLFGVTVLALMNIRNLSLFIIGTIPFISSYISPLFKKLSKQEKQTRLLRKEKIHYICVILFLIIYTSIFIFYVNTSFTEEIEDGINKILDRSKAKDVTLYTNYSNGSYAEYRGLKTYIDTRAEIFSIKLNKKEDIIKEYYMLCNGYLKYQDFVDKYLFTHMLIEKNEYIYKDALKDKNYKIIYKTKDYSVFERKNS